MNTAAVQTKQKRLFLIDGYGFVFRAYHSLPPLTRSDGTPVNAVLGFTNMIMRLKDNLNASKDDYMAVILDAGQKTFRNDLYSDYKANRPPAPEDLKPQFPLISEAIKALGLPAVSMAGYEADDIIATYAKQAKELDMLVTIVSSDKDLMQLVDSNISMYDAMKSKLIKSEQVEEKFGVLPDKVIDVQALIGDSSDNVPGVPGIGPKTAAELITTYGSLDDVLARASEVKQNKRRENLIEFAEQARLSRELVTLCKDVPIAEKINDFTIREPDPDTLLAFLRENNFRALLARMEKLYGTTPEPQNKQQTPKKPNKQNYRHITSEAELGEWLNNITDKFAIYTLTTADDISAIALSAGDGEACFIPISEPDNEQGAFDLLGEGSPAKNSLSVGQAFSAIQKICEDPSILTVGHDIKPLYKIALESGVNLTATDDISVMSYVLDGTSNKHDIVTLAELHLEKSLSPEKGLIAMENSERKSAICEYVETIYSLHTIYRHRLFSENMLTIYETIERPLIAILASMEMAGVKADTILLSTLSQEFAKEIGILEKDIHDIAGHEFNIGSPKQLGEILFEEMGIDGGKKSKKSGAYATGAEILEDLSTKGHVIADKVLRWRMLSKLRNTYTDALPQQINPKTGRIHSTFAMTVTSTGRLSSLNPNLQNIPIRTEEGKRIRNAFIADENNVLISADYSQIELRLLAHMADIAVLKEAFANGTDIHALTASQVFDLPLEKIDSATRRRAKAINFGIIYGQSPFGLARQLGISRTDAKQYIDRYFTQYPGIRAYMDRTKEFAHTHGYVTTLFGRKCYLPGINDKNPARKAFAERAAINAPLQGTAADIIKKAMITLPNQLKENNYNARIILQIHDELILESAKQDADKVAKTVQNVMEDVISLDIPLIAEANTGKSWGKIH